MKKSISFLAAFVVFALLYRLSPAQQGPQGIIEKAIAAHGGEAKIALLNQVHSKAEGTIDVLPGEAPVRFVSESWRLGNDSKMTVQMRVKGVKVSVTDAVHGDTQWRQLFGQTQELSKEEVAEIQESRYVDRLAKLGFLKDDALELSTQPDAKVGDKAATCVLVKSPGHKDVKLYFEKESGLLGKVEHTALDLLSGKEVREELVLSDYQDKDGLKYAMRSELYRDGKKIMNGKVTELEFVEKMDPAIFARP